MTVSVAPRTVRDVLEPWCAAGLTGALRLIDAPGGTVYLLDGRVSSAECPLVCGVDRLLTASGRLPPEAWRAAVAAGRTGRRIGEVLLEQGHLTRAELELTVLTALYDAAYFIFRATGDAQFEAGAAPALGPVYTVDFATVDAELRRRHRALEAAWSHPTIDTAPVLPVRHLPGHHVTLTSPQWEIVANADRRRSPVDLARGLGRDAYAILLEVRRLAHAGLVEPGRPRTTSARTNGIRATIDADLDADTTVPADPRPVRATTHPAVGVATVPAGDHPPEPDPPPPAEAPQGTVELVPAPVVLPRRPVDHPPDRGLWSGPAGPVAAHTGADACSDSTLTRILRALEAL